MTIVELQTELHMAFTVKVSLQTIAWALHREGLTQKAVCRIFFLYRCSHIQCHRLHGVRWSKMHKTAKNSRHSLILIFGQIISFSQMKAISTSSH